MYIENKANQGIIPDILQTLMKLTENGMSSDRYQHDLMKVLMDNGYVHFFSRVVKKQHELLLKYIEKNVEKIHLVTIYPIEA